MNKVTFKKKGAGGSFQPATKEEAQGLQPFSVPTYVKWLTDNSTEEADFFFHFDEELKNGLDGSGTNLGMLFESRTYTDNPNMYWGWIVPHILNNFELYKQSYRYIFTSWKDLVLMGAPFVFKPWGASRLNNKNKKMYNNKYSLCSMLLTTADVCEGHRHRLDYYSRNEKYIDRYGRGTNRELLDVDYYLAFQEYAFSVGMDNSYDEFQMSDKLLDPILCGSIPIYYGGKELVKKTFDMRGILFTDEFDLKDLSFELYDKMLPYAKENFKMAMDIPSPDDYIYMNTLRNI